MKWYFTRRKIKNAALFLRTYGVRLFFKEALKDILQRPWLFSTRRYKVWIRQNEPAGEVLLKQKEADFAYAPKVSIVVPVYNTRPLFLKVMIDSVLSQTYPKWELCIADGGSTISKTKELLSDCSREDARIKIKLLKENKGIACNSNEAISLATGDYIAFLDHDDTLAPFALFEIVKTLNESPDADFIYSDEDLISEDGKRRFEPHFKPDWSPDLLRSCNYITHLTVLKGELLEKCGGFREGFEGSQDYDLILRATEFAKKIVHIPKVLYHWRLNESSCAGRPDIKPYAFEAGKRALIDHLARMEVDGTVEEGALPGLYKVSLRGDHPKVSIIIPNRDHADELEKCIESVLTRTSFENYEIIIVENGSVEARTFRLYDELRETGNIRIIKWEKPFNYSAVNNYAARIAGGEILLFLNNDTEVINPDWLERMLEHAARKDIGAVGAKLYYPDNTIQHAGVVLRTDGMVLHSHRFLRREAFGYRARLKIIQNVSAVTGACMMMRKRAFEEVGGFDEGYEVTFGDIDLCLRVREKGYLVLWTPYAELYHHELKTRGYDNTMEKRERVKREELLFRSRWKNVLEKGDPYYSPNLSQDSEDFAIRI
ncbi:MAG: glycosyltransferase family 2 protein [Nitrospiraceae bacterium]|nr:glycosyltransferase family 2 protein [Nitrospiraceae bacterium]